MSDDWSDLADCFEELVEEEVSRVKLEAMKVFAEPITTPVEARGLAPVDTGNWLANNILTVNKTTTATNDNFDPDGFDTLSDILYKVYHSRPFDDVTLQNNSDYNTEVEYTGWNKTPAYRPYRTAFGILQNKLKDI